MKIENINQEQKAGGLINKITGRNDNKIPVTSFIDPNEINSFFYDISTDPYYTAPELEEIPEGTRVPMLTVEMVSKFPQNQKCTSSGPDDLPYWFWKEFGVELAPTITKIFNSSLRKGKVPKVWKRADLIPAPKEATLQGAPKKCPEYKIASKLDICKMTNNQQQPTANIGHQVHVHLSQYCFHVFHFVSGGGSSKCLICFIFKWLALKNFKLKIIFFAAVRKYGMLLLICENFRKNDT